MRQLPCLLIEPNFCLPPEFLRRRAMDPPSTFLLLASWVEKAAYVLTLRLYQRT